MDCFDNANVHYNIIESVQRDPHPQRQILNIQSAFYCWIDNIASNKFVLLWFENQCLYLLPSRAWGGKHYRKNNI